MIGEDMPYTLDDEPADTWTVEQVMNWWLLRSQAENEGELDAIVANLQQQLQQGQKELWEAHQEVSEILGDEVDDASDNEEDDENAMDVGNSQEDKDGDGDDTSKPAAASDNATIATTRTKKTATAKQTKAPATTSHTLHVVIVEGPYEGHSYNLRLKAKQHAWVGRSKGKKFVKNGISLHQDSEVSTSHGRFEYQRGKFYYMDAASTNGSLMGNEYLEPNAPYELENGMYITVGQTIMQVAIPVVKEEKAEETK